MQQRLSRLPLVALGLAALLHAAPVRAGASSMDVELLDPSFAAGAIPGSSSARFDGPGALRVGSLIQYERDPLLLVLRHRVHGAVLQHRVSLQSGFSYDWSRRLSTSLLLPFAAQSGDEVPPCPPRASGCGIPGSARGWGSRRRARWRRPCAPTSASPWGRPRPGWASAQRAVRRG